MKVLDVKENSIPTLISLKSGETEYLEAGKYLVMPRFINAKFSCLKNAMGGVWVSAGGEKFPVLKLPLTHYQCKILGVEMPHSPISFEVERFSALQNAIEKAGLILRDGQKKILDEILDSILSGQPYRKMILAGMGSGKTLLMVLLSSMFDNPVFVTPKTTIANVEIECKKRGVRVPYLTTYESLKKINFQPDALFLDEIDRVKNPYSNRSGQVNEYTQGSKLVLGASATPFSAKEWMDCRSLNAIMGSEIVPNSEKAFSDMFAARMVLEEHRPEEYHNVVTDWNSEMVKEFIEPHIISMDNQEAMKDVKPIKYVREYVDRPDNYDKCRAGAYTKKGKSKVYAQCRMITGGGVYNDDEKYVRLKASKKLERLKTLVKEIVDREGSVIVDAYFTEEIDVLAEALKGWNPAVLKSDMIQKEQKNVLESIDAGLVKVLIKSASLPEGLNLQFAFHTMIRYSLGTSPIRLKQSEGRIYRPGQVHEPVVIDLLCKDTEDEKVLDLLNKHIEETEDFIDKILMETF